MSEMKLEWGLGMDNVSPEAALPDGAVVDAVNVDIDRAGGVARRAGHDEVTSGNFHSLWATKDKSRAFVVTSGGVLNELTSALAATSLYTLAANRALSYDTVNDAVVCCNRYELLSIGVDQVVRRMGVEIPGVPVNNSVSLSASPTVGGLDAGRYGVALSFLVGNEESGLSPASFITLQQDEGIVVQLPAPVETIVTGIRIYRTEANGDVLRRAIDAPVGLSQYTIGASPVGRQADTQFLARMPGGDIVRYWRGRLLVARGKRIYFSEPMRYGMYSPREGFIQLPKDVRMMRPVSGGVYIGTEDGVKFYAGAGPKDLSPRDTGGKPPVAGTDTLVDAEEFGDIGVKDEEVALWLAANGFVVGTPDGKLVEVQANRVRLPSGAAGVGAVVVSDRKAVAVVL